MGPEEWVNEVTGTGWSWYAKRLSGNDTLLNGSHQAGPYIPSPVIFTLFPGVNDSRTLNPRLQFPVIVNSHLAPEKVVTAIWYNNKVVEGGTRNECRVTNWGGNASPILDPESTGSLCIFAFYRQNNQCNAEVCRVWLCSTVEQEEFFENITGPVEPGHWYWSERTAVTTGTRTDPCQLSESAILSEWGERFPSGQEIVEKVLQLKPQKSGQSPDKRLMLRRDCEYTVFRSLEELHVMPRIRSGFTNIEEFTDFANSVLNRRKSRSGKSLELQAMKIFLEEGLTQFAHDQVSEGKKKPDFLFPSQEAYQDPSFPTEKLRMLGVKTTCKDRWRQVTKEADRIDRKHLLTLQEGVSLNQFSEMRDSGVILVVPESLHGKFHKDIRSELLGFGDFVAETGVLVRY